MRPNPLLACALVASMALSACGDGDDGGSGGAKAPVATETPAAAETATAPSGVGPLEAATK